MRIDWLILADAAQVIGNKLFLLGGGWDVITLQGPPPVVHRAAIAVAIRVGWHETNRKHTMELQVVHDDGAVLATLNGEIQVAQPPDAMPGQDQRIQFAANLDLNITEAGGYALVARINGQEEDRSPFRVVLAAQT